MNTEEILARCITEIEHGVSIEECLSHYSVQAEELRPLLELALRFRSTRPVRMSDRAFDRGRQLLRQQAQQSTAPRRQPPFFRRYQSQNGRIDSRVMPVPIPNQRIPEVVRRRPLQPYLIWVSALSSATIVIIGVFLFARLSELNASNPLPEQPSASVPTYTATSIHTTTQMAPIVPISATPALSTATATPTPTLTLTTVPTTTSLPGEFVPAPHTATPTFTPTALPSQTADMTASPTDSATSPQVLATPTPTNPAMQPPVSEITPTSTPILMITSTATTTPLQSSPPTFTMTATATATATSTTTSTSTSTQTSTPTLTLTSTSTSTPTLTEEPPSATPTFPPPTATATDTPPEVTATATFIFRPIVTVEMSLTPEEPTNGTIEHAISTPTPSPSENDSSEGGN